jgi:hypothetical protein
LDHERIAVHVEGSFEGRRAPSVVVGAILAGVLLALVKPWSFGVSSAPETRPPPRSSTAPVVVTAAPPPGPRLDPNGMLCLGGDVEQVVEYERWANDEVRSWIAVDDVAVTGPLDPRMARLTIFSSHVVGLGICGLFAGDGLPVAGRILDVQLLPGTPGAPARDLGRPRQITLELGGQDAAVLYGSPQELVLPDPTAGTWPPSPGTGGPGATDTVVPTLRPWSSGLYAIAFVFAGDDGDVVRWLGIDLVPGPGQPR